VLHELRVENLLLMERAELRLGPGLNILTGETGAGKTLLAHALDLLLGGRARSGIVRAGAAEAYVEGTFAIPPGLDDDLVERLPEDAEELVLARRVWPDGRTRAYVSGRSATLADLRELGSMLLAFYGQHEHRKLMLAAAQLAVLDAYCGPDQERLLERMREAHGRASSIERRVLELSDDAGARDRELDLARFELEEIEGVAPSEPEHAELLAERDRLRHQEVLRDAASAGAEALVAEEGRGAVELLAAAVKPIESAASIDPGLESLSQRLSALAVEGDELARELRGYLVGLEVEPGRLELVEERLGALARLQRKHGGSIEQVLAHAERCRDRIDQLEHADTALEEARQELMTIRSERDHVAAQLSARRAAAADDLAAAVRERLHELAMPEAQFEVRLHQRDDGCGAQGTDVAEFVIAPNPGLPAGPLREIGSGGELSRVMLALLSAAHSAADEEAVPGPLLVFDEIDAGIGGHTARAVAAHLRELAATRQILCITHLPQVAAVGDRHFAIVKDAAREPARTEVAELSGDRVVGELVRMLGAGEDDRAASRHARALLRAA
jgi:DNA repair protein RecN (Recombination protein N)